MSAESAAEADGPLLFFKTEIVHGSHRSSNIFRVETRSPAASL
jgi:hypothetical protein